MGLILRLSALLSPAMPSIGSFFELIYLHYAVKWYEWRQQRLVKKAFYSNPSFKEVDTAVCRSLNPYRVPLAFPYGETPLLTLKVIADRSGLSSKDKVVELGCGRGRSVFFLSHYKRCQVKGIEWVPGFVAHAQSVARRFKVEGVSFTCADMRQADLKDATFVYLYGTCLDDASIEQIKIALKALPAQAKIVTVSYPIEGFKIEDQFTASFPWGEGGVFVLTPSPGSRG